MTTIYKPVFVVDGLGELGNIPDNSIVNIGGVAGPNFTVGGKGLLFDDGTSTGGGGGNLGISLQSSYNASATPAQINLVTGKNFVLNALNGKRMSFDAATGRLLVEGDLTVLGDSSIIEGTISNLDQVNIQPPNAGTVGLTIEPAGLGAHLANLLEVRAFAGGPLVFNIGPTGTTQLTDIFISGSINGTPVVDLLNHLDAGPGKHTAEQISFDDTGLVYVEGADVQAALESIDARLNQLNTGNVTGFEYVQPVPIVSWLIAHGSGSDRIHATIWDEENEVMLPDRVKIIDSNTVQVLFSSPQAGRAILMIF